MTTSLCNRSRGGHVTQRGYRLTRLRASRCSKIGRFSLAGHLWRVAEVEFTKLLVEVKYLDCV